jgi:DNA-binding PadR family transcriptional regulator
MVQSVLEMTTALVKAHLETYRLSPGQVVRMLENVHAKQLLVQRREETSRHAPPTAPDERTEPLADKAN